MSHLSKSGKHVFKAFEPIIFRSCEPLIYKELSLLKSLSNFKSDLFPFMKSQCCMLEFRIEFPISSMVLKYFCKKNHRFVSLSYPIRLFKARWRITLEVLEFIFLVWHQMWEGWNTTCLARIKSLFFYSHLFHEFHHWDPLRWEQLIYFAINCDRWNRCCITFLDWFTSLTLYGIIWGRGIF